MPQAHTSQQREAGPPFPLTSAWPEKLGDGNVGQNGGPGSGPLVTLGGLNPSSYSVERPRLCRWGHREVMEEGASVSLAAGKLSPFPLLHLPHSQTITEDLKPPCGLARSVHFPSSRYGLGQITTVSHCKRGNTPLHPCTDTCLCSASLHPDICLTSTKGF